MILRDAQCFVAVTGTRIVYDHWEAGYELDLNNPTPASTQVWGDGNNAKGISPGFTHDPVSLPAGTVNPLRNLVPLPRNPGTLLYEACDRVGATRGSEGQSHSVPPFWMVATAPGSNHRESNPFSRTDRVTF
jgi:hypothetical protein